MPEGGSSEIPKNDQSLDLASKEIIRSKDILLNDKNLSPEEKEKLQRQIDVLTKLQGDPELQKTLKDSREGFKRVSLEDKKELARKRFIILGESYEEASEKSREKRALEQYLFDSIDRFLEKEIKRLDDLALQKKKETDTKVGSLKWNEQQRKQLEDPLFKDKIMDAVMKTVKGEKLEGYSEVQLEIIQNLAIFEYALEKGGFDKPSQLIEAYMTPEAEREIKGEKEKTEKNSNAIRRFLSSLREKAVQFWGGDEGRVGFFVMEVDEHYRAKAEEQLAFREKKEEYVLSRDINTLSYQARGESYAEYLDALETGDKGKIQKFLQKHKVIQERIELHEQKKAALDPIREYLQQGDARLKDALTEVGKKIPEQQRPKLEDYVYDHPLTARTMLSFVNENPGAGVQLLELESEFHEKFQFLAESNKDGYQIKVLPAFGDPFPEEMILRPVDTIKTEAGAESLAIDVFSDRMGNQWHEVTKENFLEKRGKVLFCEGLRKIIPNTIKNLFNHIPYQYFDKDSEKVLEEAIRISEDLDPDKNVIITEKTPKLLKVIQKDIQSKNDKLVDTPQKDRSDFTEKQLFADENGVISKEKFLQYLKAMKARSQED